MNTSGIPGLSGDRGPGPGLVHAVIAELGVYRLATTAEARGDGAGRASVTRSTPRHRVPPGGAASLPVRVYRAELVTLARLAGQLITDTSSAHRDRASTLVVTINHPVVAQRARWLLGMLTEGDCTVDEHPPQGHGKTRQLLVSGAVHRLSMRLGLLDRRGRTVRGLPASVVADPAPEVAAAIWRAALLHNPRFLTHHRPGAVDIWCPDPAVALALTGAARRLGIPAQTRPPAAKRTGSTVSRPDRHDATHNHDHQATTSATHMAGASAGVGVGQRVVITDPTRVATLLGAAGAPDAAASWLATANDERTATDPHSGGHRSGHSGGAALAGHNHQRSQQAARHNVDAARRALALYADTVPFELAEAGRLRLAHPTASLTELAALADPPTTKDTIAGRLRRLTLRLTAG